MTQTWKKIATVSLAAVMLTGSLAGCGQKAVSIDKENPSINVMTKAYNTESASPDTATAVTNTDFREEEIIMRYLTVALAKGRLAELAMELFISIGMDCSEMKEKTRKLIFTDEKNKMKFILVKASDVPTYVEYGAADIGIVGKDTLLEESRNLYEMVDLGFGKCKMAVCGPKELKGKLDTMTNLRVASKYPHIAMKYFQDDKGQTIEIIKLNGSVELAPLVGLSDVIVDIVETGKTLYENARNSSYLSGKIRYFKTNGSKIISFISGSATFTSSIIRLKYFS